MLSATLGMLTMLPVGFAVAGYAKVGELSAGVQSDLAVDADAVDGLFAAAVVAGYREEQKRQLLAEAARCSTPIDRLLEGRPFDERSLWEVAGCVRPYGVTTHGAEELLAGASLTQSRGLPSAVPCSAFPTGCEGGPGVLRAYERWSGCARAFGCRGGDRWAKRRGVSGAVDTVARGGHRVGGQAAGPVRGGL